MHLRSPMGNDRFCRNGTLLASLVSGHACRNKPGYLLHDLRRHFFEKYPKLRVAFAHGGGSFPATVARIEHGHKVRPDLCAIDNDKSPRTYLGRFWIDSLVHDPRILDYLIDLVGADRIALGSDYPFPLGEEVPVK